MGKIISLDWTLSSFIGAVERGICWSKKSSREKNKFLLFRPLFCIGTIVERRSNTFFLLVLFISHLARKTKNTVAHLVYYSFVFLCRYWSEGEVSLQLLCRNGF